MSYAKDIIWRSYTKVVSLMDKPKTKILMLVEGEKTDVKLMTHLLDVYGLNKNHEIVSYNTNIYVLYGQMFAEHKPEDYDLPQVLKARESDENKKSLFDQPFSDIILIFDFDPQDPNYSPNKIEEMVAYFRESSDMGKLYINYPMVEAFYHMKDIPDPSFNTYTASMNELKARQYKTRVRQESKYGDYRRFASEREDCSIVIRQNIEKSQYIVGESSARMNDSPDSLDLLNAQLALLSSENEVYVLCTCVFYILDYNPALIS